MSIFFPFRLLFLIALLTIINYLDRSALSFAILPLERELGFGDMEFGMILGAFGMGYVSMSFVSGFLLDRFGSIRIWTIGAAVWSLCTLSFGFVTGFWSMVMLRVCLGFAEGLHFPALLKTVTDWLPSCYRARALSFSLLGVPVASLIGAPLLTFLIRALSWQSMFIILGVFGLVWACLWPLCFRNRTNPRYGDAPQSGSSPQTFWKIAKHPPFMASCIAYFGFGYLVFFGLLWLPGFLEKQIHSSIQNTGTLLMIPWSCSALLILVGGFVSDWLWEKTGSLRKARSYLIMGGLCIAGISFFLIAYTRNTYAIIALLSTGLGFGFLMNAPIYALNADLFPNRMATAQGIMVGFFGLAGIIAPIATGFLVERSGNFDAAFILLACVCAVGALAVFALQRK